MVYILKLYFVALFCYKLLLYVTMMQCAFDNCFMVSAKRRWATHRNVLLKLLMREIMALPANASSTTKHEANTKTKHDTNLRLTLTLNMDIVYKRQRLG